jgi:hypothetical protein
MELTVYELALIAGGFGIAGTLLGVLGTYRLSINLADMQFRHLREISKLDAWRAAAKEFVAAFSLELATLEGNEELPIGYDDYLRRAYDSKHKVAITTFAHFVPKIKSAGFKAACQEYHSSQVTQDMIETGISPREAMFIEYMGMPFFHPTLRPHELAASRIHAILEFARHE